MSGSRRAGNSAGWPLTRSLAPSDGERVPGGRVRGPRGRVGMTGYTVTPLSEPDERNSHPALRTISQSANVNCGSEAAGRVGMLCLTHSPTSDFRCSLNQARL